MLTFFVIVFGHFFRFYGDLVTWCPVNNEISTGFQSYGFYNVCIKSMPENTYTYDKNLFDNTIKFENTIFCFARLTVIACFRVFMLEFSFI